MTRNAALPRAKNKVLKAETTASDVADLVEYSINETEPKLKTSRGTGDEVLVKIGGRKWMIKVYKRPTKRELTRQRKLAEK